MVKGIKSGFKQVIGYFLCKDSMSGSLLRNIVIKALHLIMESGYIPKCVMCDQGPNNIKM